MSSDVQRSSHSFSLVPALSHEERIANAKPPKRTKEEKEVKEKNEEEKEEKNGNEERIQVRTCFSVDLVKWSQEEPEKEDEDSICIGNIGCAF